MYLHFHAHVQSLSYEATREINKRTHQIEIYKCSMFCSKIEVLYKINTEPFIFYLY